MYEMAIALSNSFDSNNRNNHDLVLLSSVAWKLKRQFQLEVVFKIYS